MIRQMMEQVMQFFSDAAISGKVRHEGQVTRVEIAGTEPMDRITGYIGKGCQAAIDRSVEGSMLGPEQRLPAANHLLVSVYLDHDRAVRYQQVTDTRDLSRHLARATTEYAHKQRYLLIGNRVEVPAITIRDTDAAGRERVEVFWRRSEPFAQGYPGPSASQPANEPSSQKVKGSDKITAESSEDEARLSERFALWVKDGDEEPALWDGLLTPFYFGKETKHPQVVFRFSDRDQISRDHFAILYLPRERFLLRNNGRNGTIIIRGSQAVRLYTPPALRERPGSAKVARLAEGDIIRLQAGPLAATRIVQMVFCRPGTPLDSVHWADSLDGIDCADTIEVVARRPRDGAPPEQYTLICGEQFLGSAITQGIKFSYSQEDQGFVGGTALAAVTNFGGVVIRWMRPDVSASASGVRIPAGRDVPLRPGDQISFGEDGSAIPPTRVVFEWTESWAGG